MMEVESHKEGTVGNGSSILRRVMTSLYERLLIALPFRVVYIRFMLEKTSPLLRSAARKAYSNKSRKTFFLFTIVRLAV